MAKRSSSSQPERKDTSEVSDKVELQKEALPLGQRVTSGRGIPIEKIRGQYAKVKVSDYASDPTKFLAKVYRANTLVAQELVDKADYSIAQVEQAYRDEILAGNYDHHLTVVYQEQKQKKKS